jgi:hypothetical protein
MQKEHLLAIVDKFHSELLIVRVVLIQTDPRSIEVSKYLNKNSEWNSKIYFKK